MKIHSGCKQESKYFIEYDTGSIKFVRNVIRYWSSFVISKEQFHKKNLKFNRLKFMVF